MNASYLPLLVGLLALLVGLAVGKAWERYKLRDGRWIDRRKARESPHYIVGLDLLVSDQIDLAIDELNKAAGMDANALEIHMILGNLYREKGHVGRAISVHQGLLQKPKLRKLEHAYVLLCLGLDFKRAGFVDRANEAFKEVLRLDPRNRHALIQLEKLHEEQHGWADAYAIRQQLAEIEGEEGRRRNELILGFLEHAMGRQAVEAGDPAEAARRFQAAIDRDPQVVPAYLELGDLYRSRGERARAAETWERVVDVSPDRAYLVFSRLQSIRAEMGTPQRFADLCQRLIAGNPQDWRARLALAGARTAAGEPAAALELLFEALTHNPHALTIHQEIWRTLSLLDRAPQLVDRYLALTREAVLFTDPHTCLRCRNRSTELLWQCPQCHEWNSFVEERIAPARDDEQVSN